MTSLTLALDNIDVTENTEQISKLFPKCRPRSDINLNPIILSGRDHECIENTTNTVMSVDSENDRWIADSSCNVSRDNTSQLQSTDDDDIIIEHKHTGGTYKLRDSRIIEIAGGREIYSQSRSKALRKSRNSLVGEDGEKKVQKSPMRQGVWELRARNETKKSQNSRDYTETVFSSEVCSVAHEKNAEAATDKSSPINMTFPGEVVVFDDIGENWHVDENKRIQKEHLHTATKVFNTSDTDSEKVTKVIGNLPIAVYEGSPRRYGQRHTDSNCTHPQLPSAQSLLASPSVYPPRPGFPQRVVSTPSPVENDSNLNIENHTSNKKYVSPNATTTSTFDYLYEFSETRKVLEEFFKCPPTDEENRLEVEFQDLEYELRRQASDSGNSYVGQRLAKTLPEENEFCVRIDSPRKCINTNLSNLVHDHDITEHENNFLDLSIGTGSSGDLGETEVGLQVGHSRNFTLSPETTDCDSNCGDLDSEASLMLMENDLGPSGGLLGSNTDLVIPSDSLRLYSSMPVLEDGLSSGHASDTDNNNPTVMLMKRQITEIEREINQGICKSNSTKINENGLSPKNEIRNASPIDINGCVSSFEEPMTISQTDSLEKTPPPPAPAPHRLMQGEKTNDVEAALKDIRLTLQRTKTLPLQRHPEEDGEENAASPIWVPRQRGLSTASGDSERKVNSAGEEEENDTDLETDRLLGQQRTDDQGFYDDKGWRKPKSRTIMPPLSLANPKILNNMDEGTLPLVPSETQISDPPSPTAVSEKSQSPQSQKGSVSSNKIKKEKDNKKKGRNKEDVIQRSVLIEGVLFRARYLGSTQLVCEGQPTKTTRMMQAEEAVSRIKEVSNQMIQNYGQSYVPSSPESGSIEDDSQVGPQLGMITQHSIQPQSMVEVDEEGGRKRRKRLKKNMVEVAVTKIKAPDGESQPSTEVDLFISTEKIMVLNTDLKEIMMDHALRTISYIADIGDLVVLMARRRFVPHEMEDAPKINRTPKMICHVFESEEAQFIAQSIGQAFQVAYMEFLKANGIEDHSFVKEMDYQEVLNSQEIFGDELQMFAKKEMQKEVVVPKAKGEILGVVIVESGWGSMLPTVVIANLAPAGAAARCGQLNIGDQIIAINGVSLVGLPLSTCQTYIKNSKNQTVVKLTVVPCAPVVEVKIKRPDTKYQLGFSVQNGVICSLLRGGIAERGGVRVGHRIIEINNQSVVAVPHEKIVNLLATSVGEASYSTAMLSPKMQRTIRVNENQLIMLSERAHYDYSQAGYLHKRSADSNKWQLRWFVLYQNLLFYYDSEHCHRPSGILILEGCYCERLITTGSASKSKDGLDRQFCFAISYRRENIRQYELRALSEMECKNWIEAIREASFNKLLLQKEELEQKHLHLLQIVESEKTAKWQYTLQCEELATEIKKLRAELFALKKEWKPLVHHQSSGSISSSQRSCSSEVSGHFANLDQDSIELRKIKKVQSFFRGWLCRRRWKQIVEQYIKSPHAESMRKRNSLVFRMVEDEEEYMEQMEVLVTCFLRPFRMAASSKKPPCSHEDISSIFLNSETVLFLHQIFLKGLTSRLESWPTLVLGDLFSMLLPMLSIYQEYVRNHHYSLQVLTECKQSVQFSALLKRLENKSACRGRSLEAFLTYPMHQVPRYIITLHELLAHTPHDHVERKSLENARQQLEDLSRQMHDEVSETENLRKNLAVERMIVEGCDILLDVNQVFVRQGSLIQLPNEKPKAQRSKLPFKTDKEIVRQCFLFSNHLIIASRTSSGKLHLIPDVGKIPLADALLIEDPHDNLEDEESSICSVSSQSTVSETSVGVAGYHNRDFKIIVETKNITQAGQFSIHLLASSIQEKTAWISDITQCLDNVQFNDMMRPAMPDSSSISLPQSIKNDPKLFRDEADIRFSRTLNSCKVPQIRYATPERLLQRLTDLRFLSIDFLNTFLLTYRVFTDGVSILEALKKVFYSIDQDPQELSMSFEGLPNKDENTLQLYDDRRRSSFSPRRTSGASSVSGYGSEMSDRDRSHSYDSQGHRVWKATLQMYEEEGQETEKLKIIKHSPTKASDTLAPPGTKPVSIRVDTAKDNEENQLLTIPKVAASSSSETLTDITVLSAQYSPSNLSSVTLVGSSPSDNSGQESSSSPSKPPSKPSSSPKTSPTKVNASKTVSVTSTKTLPSTKPSPTKPTVKTLSPTKDQGTAKAEHQKRPSITLKQEPTDKLKSIQRGASVESEDQSEDHLYYSHSHRASCSSSRSASISTSTGIIQSLFYNYYGSRRSIQDSDASTARSSFQHETSCKPSRAGVVITSFRQSKRRSSTSSAATAFAIATSGSSNPRDISPGREQEDCNAERERQKESVMSTACTMRVLNVLRHWISKHSQDFENDLRLKNLTIEFLEDIIYSPNLLPAEHKAAAQLLRLLTKEESESSKVDIQRLLTPTAIPSKESIETLSALEIAEQLTVIDHQIFVAISSEEFLGQVWMKFDKDKRAPHILMMTKRFNHVSRLVSSEILRRKSITARVSAIEKWAAVADIARCLHNFNGVLQICSAFTNTSIFRLKKTWEKVSKTTKHTMEKLQNVVSSDGRFRSLRDALHRCDPPCIPYLGIYLTDLSFIEEGTPNFTAEGLLNFSKMRMIAHVIREIRHFQQTPYKIELIQRVANYLLDPTIIMDDEELYSTSLELEPRTSRLVSQSSTTTIK